MNDLTDTSGGMDAGGMYDPVAHENQLVAVYETMERARAAREDLIKDGVLASAIDVAERPGADSGEMRSGTTEDEGFFGAIKRIFAPEEDVTAYHHAVDRGHAMLIVTIGPETDRQRVLAALDRTEPVDFDAQIEEWQRQPGYDPTRRPGWAEAPSAAAGVAGGGAAAANLTTPAAAPAGGASGEPADAASAGLSGLDESGAGVSETALGGAPEGGMRREPAVSGKTRPPSGTAGAPGSSMPTSDTLKVVQERLRVGKREQMAGAVRVRSYVVERPVEEQVRLREERVQLDRRKVDREATEADLKAFGEQTIEARATREEPVIEKQARVVEEIGIRKETGERTETVRDTVRETQVEVEDDSTKGRPRTAKP